MIEVSTWVVIFVIVMLWGMIGGVAYLWLGIKRQEQLLQEMLKRLDWLERPDAARRVETQEAGRG